MTLQHTIQRKENQHPLRQNGQALNRTAIRSIATQTSSRSSIAQRHAGFQSNLTTLPVLQLKCNCEEKNSSGSNRNSRKRLPDNDLIQLKGKTLKQIKAQERREKKDAQKGTPGQGIGHDAAETGAKLTCYENTGCKGSKRTFASAHNCCSWGESYRYGSSSCTSCRHQTTVTSKH